MQKDKYSAREKKECNLKFCSGDYEYNQEKVTSVGIIVLNQKQEIICVEIERGVDMPGGHLQEGETPEEALKREYMEEAFITIKNYKKVGVVESDYFGNKPEELTYMLFYIGELDEKFEFIKNTESFARYELSPKEFQEKYKGDQRYLTKIYSHLFN